MHIKLIFFKEAEMNPQTSRTFFRGGGAKINVFYWDGTTTPKNLERHPKAQKEPKNYEPQIHNF